MQTVFVALDGSPDAERVLPSAEGVALLAGAEIALVSAVGDESTDDRVAYLEGVAARMAVPSIRIEVKHRQHVATAILDAAAEVPDSIVCMATHGRGTVGRALIGSTTEAVLESGTRAAMLAGPHCDPAWPEHPGPLLVPLDGSPFANRIIPLAITTAETLGLAPTLLFVANPLDAETPGHGEAELRPALDLFEAAGIAASHAIIFEEPPSPHVAAFAAEIGASLVIMGTHLRSGVRRLALGSVAMATVHKAHCPVLVQNLHRVTPTA